MWKCEIVEMLKIKWDLKLFKNGFYLEFLNWVLIEFSIFCVFRGILIGKGQS